MEPDTEPFIDSIRSYVCLWDTEDDTYSDMPTRDAAWAKIIEQHNIPDVLTAKRRWKKLRDIHREVYKRHRAGRPGKHNKPWKYYSAMEFLIPHITARPRHSETPEEPLAAQSESDAVEASDDDHVHKAKKPKRDNGAVKKSSASFIECKPELLSESDEGSANREPDQDAYYYRQQRPNALLSLDHTSGPDSDPMSKFFGAMCDASKQLPELYQLEIRRKLFSAVSEAEELYLKSNR